MFAQGFLADLKAETCVEGGSFGEEPFEFFQRGGASVFVGENYWEVAYHPRHLLLVIEILLL